MSKENYAKVEAAVEAAEKARSAYQKAAETDTTTVKQLAELSQAVRDSQQAVSDAITVGCSPCPSCGSMPHGLRQNFEIDKRVYVGFEIGCLACPDHCAVGFLAEELEDKLALAVKKWNAGPDKWFCREKPLANGVTLINGDGRELSDGQKVPNTGDVFACSPPQGKRTTWLVMSMKMSPPSAEEVADGDTDHDALYRRRLADRGALYQDLLDGV